MNRPIPYLALLALLAAGCKDATPAGAPAKAPAEAPSYVAGEVPDDPKTLYRVTASADEAKAGEPGIVHLAIQPVEGAVVKAETPFRGKLAAKGPISVPKEEFAYEDRAEEVGGGPVFAIPFEAKEAGEGTIEADLTFFVCVAEACMRTTESLSVPVLVN